MCWWLASDLSEKYFTREIYIEKCWNRSSTVFSQSDGNETPFVNKEILPKIDGVLIVAEGGADASVRKNISEAVEALFGLDAHKIKIVKMKGDSN